jgi:hypothetical protein
VIVLFTDGQPNGITAKFNAQGNSVIKASSTCVNKNDGGVAAKSMIGWMAQWGNFASGTALTKDGRGVYGLSQSDNVTQTSVTNWLIHGSEPVLSGATGKPAEGCAFVGNQANIPSDLTIPTADLYGNSTTGSAVAPYTLTDYQQSAIWGTYCNNANRVLLDLTKSNDACQIGLASWNAADMAGKQIRADATLTPIIYTMGYKGNGGDDPALMKRLSNVKGQSTVYDSTRPQGVYLPISTVNDIAPAFQSVLAEILRLST